MLTALLVVDTLQAAQLGRCLRPTVPLRHKIRARSPPPNGSNTAEQYAQGARRMRGTLLRSSHT